MQTAVLGDVPGVVAGRRLRLIGALLLLIHDDEADVPQRREHRRPGSQHDVRLATADALKLVIPLGQAQAAVQQRHLVPKIRGKARHHLRRQRDLRHQDHHGPAAVQQLLRQPDIDQRFAAAGHTLQQRDARFPGQRLLQNVLIDLLLLVV